LNRSTHRHASRVASERDLQVIRWHPPGHSVRPLQRATPLEIPVIFKHKLSRRLAALCGAALLALAVGCVDGPTESANSELLVGGAQSISPATAKVGDRVVANRWLQVLSGPSRRSNAIGHQ